MKFFWFIFLFVSFTTNAVVYRWYDEQGRVVYSDEHKFGAEVIDMPSLSTYVPTPIPQAIVVIDDDVSEEIAAPIYNVKITSPIDDATIWANDGNLLVKIDLNPALDSERNDKIIIMLDNQQQGNAITNTSFTLTNLERGTHSLIVSVVDNAGKLLKLSQTVTFHLHKRAQIPRPAQLPSN